MSGANREECLLFNSEEPEIVMKMIGSISSALRNRLLYLEFSLIG